MLHKSGNWFADWLDEKGHRRRKGFTTKRAALRFQTKARFARTSPEPLPWSSRRASGRRVCVFDAGTWPGRLLSTSGAGNHFAGGVPDRSGLHRTEIKQLVR